MPLCSSQQIEGAAHAAEHAEAEHIDLHELEGVDVVLVPFDDLPVLHRGRLDRHQFVEPVAGSARSRRDAATDGAARRSARAASSSVRRRRGSSRLRFSSSASCSARRLPCDQPQTWPDERAGHDPPAGPAPCRPRAPRRGRGSGSRRRSARRGRGRRCRRPTG